MLCSIYAYSGRARHGLKQHKLVQWPKERQDSTFRLAWPGCVEAGRRTPRLARLQVANAARSPATSYITSPAASWLDDFLSWISPEIPRCCRAFPGPDDIAYLGVGQLAEDAYFDAIARPQDAAYCPPPDQPPCSVNASACAQCSVCFRASGPPGPDLLLGGRPSLRQALSLDFPPLPHVLHSHSAEEP